MVMTNALFGDSQSSSRGSHKMFCAFCSVDSRTFTFYCRVIAYVIILGDFIGISILIVCMAYYPFYEIIFL